MLTSGEIISHAEMCNAEQMSLQRGMNFRSGVRPSVILMSLRPGAPYADRIDDDGRLLIYEGHDIPRSLGGPDPKAVDQVAVLPSGRPTENGKFASAALKYRRGVADPERVRVYEKLRSNIWAYNGEFLLLDSWTEPSNGRLVFKFKLKLIYDGPVASDAPLELDHTRFIPSDVKRAVFKRDCGCCVKCGSRDNLHFDHVIPYSKGGSSLVATNIQLLCARHNLGKSASIE